VVLGGGKAGYRGFSPSHSAKKLISRGRRENSLDHDFSAGRNRNAPSNIMAMAASAFSKRLGDDNALAGGQAVSLDHDRPRPCARA